MDVTREYKRCVFRSATVREAVAVMRALADPPHKANVWTRELQTDTDKWEYDDDDEFFAAYDTGFEQADFGVNNGSNPSLRVMAYRHNLRTRVFVRAGTRGEIERVLAVFGDQAEKVRVLPPAPPPPEPPSVFIGHGHSELWRKLSDHLHHEHGYKVEAYETGTRAGHTIRDILARMMDASTFAVVVMTAEDEQADGSVRARQNVVHEVGLFQGRLGFNRAVVAIEKGVEPFSNLDGVAQIPFGPGNIRETYGDILATLRREFPGHWT